LLEAVEKGTVRLTDLALDHKQALAAHPSEAVREKAKTVLAKGGDLPNPDRQKVIDALLPLLKQTGDVAKGKEGVKAQCAKGPRPHRRGRERRPRPDRHGGAPEA